MFDFANSLNQKRKPTRRYFASWAASCLAHGLIFLLLIEYPQLLRGGMYPRFRATALLSNLLGQGSGNEDKNWRTVAILKDSSKMSAPSAATLKKYLYDWDKKEPGAPPVRIRWGDVKAALLDSTPPMPRIRKGAQEPELALPANPVVSAGSAPVEAGQPSAQPGNGGSSAEARGDSNAGKQGTAGLPSPAPAGKGEAAPTRIPESVKPPPPKNGLDTAKVFENEQKAIRSPDSGFFDTKGFPLGEYINLIVERIKGKWFIPSNLRNSQGHTTVIFYIDRDGRFTNARIVLSSGSSSLDLAALNAILESDHAPPLPKGFPGDHVGAKFVFSYNEPQSP